MADNHKNNINDVIDWSKASCHDAEGLGYSAIEVNGLSLHRGFRGRGDFSTSGRLVLWLGDRPDGAAIYGYFDAEEALRKLKGGPPAGRYLKTPLFRVSATAGDYFTVRADNFRAAACQVAKEGKDIWTIEQFDEEAITWRQVWPVTPGCTCL